MVWIHWGDRSVKKMRARYDIRDKTVFITGPARGIGEATARMLAGKGARLALAGLEPEKLERLSGQLGERAAWFEADVTDTGQLNRAVEAAVEHFGGVDVVIANAGIAPLGSVESIDPEEFERTVDINLLGVWRTVRAALPSVVERHGYILTIASMAAVVNPPLLSHYAASKAGVAAFSNSLRMEVAGDGVDVGVAYFGFIDTDLQQDVLLHSQGKELRERLDSSITKVIPVDRAAKAIVKGVEGRARIIAAPRWMALSRFAPAFAHRVSEKITLKKARDVLAEGRTRQR